MAPVVFLKITLHLREKTEVWTYAMSSYSLSINAGPTIMKFLLS